MFLSCCVARTYLVGDLESSPSCAQIHFLCHCSVGSGLAIGWAPAGTRFYYGSLDEQARELFDSDVRLHAVLHFYTSLTLGVNARSKTESEWYVEPSDDWFVWDTAFEMLSKHSQLNIIVTDDVHHQRVFTAMQEMPSAQVAQAARWMRRRELHFYSLADVIVTVSPEVGPFLSLRPSRSLLHLTHFVQDAKLVAELLSGESNQPSNPRTPPTLWVPFVASRVASENAVASPGSRKGIFFLGVPHKLSIHSLTWFIKEVHPRLIALLTKKQREKGFADVYVGGGGSGLVHLDIWDPLRAVAQASPYAAQLNLVGGLSNEQVSIACVSVFARAETDGRARPRAGERALCATTRVHRATVQQHRHRDQNCERDGSRNSGDDDSRRAARVGLFAIADKAGGSERGVGASAPTLRRQ